MMSHNEPNRWLTGFGWFVVLCMLAFVAGGGVVSLHYIITHIGEL